MILAVGETASREDQSWHGAQQATAAMQTLTHHLLLRSIPRRNVHLRLIASAQVRDHALRTESCAKAAGLRSVKVIEVEPDDIQGASREIATSLEHDRHLGCCAEALLVTGPGTKSMNMAMVLAAGQWATNRAIPMRVGNLKESHSSAGPGAEWQSLLELDREPVLPRLGSDQMVATIVASALEWLRLSTARRVLEMASYRWRDIQPSVAQLEEELWGLGKGRHREQNAQSWFPARAQAFILLAESDPWRAIYATCAAAEAAWPSPRYDGIHGPSPWRTQEYQWGQKLWKMRNHSPFGHQVWAFPLSAATVRELIDGVIREVHERPPNGPVTFRPDDAIVMALKKVKADVQRVGAEAPLC